jgi:hypothetical protein
VGREAIGDMSEDLDPVLELHAKHSVGESLDYPPIDRDRRLGHEPRLYLIQPFSNGRARPRTG